MGNVIIDITSDWPALAEESSTATGSQPPLSCGPVQSGAILGSTEGILGAALDVEVTAAGEWPCNPVGSLGSATAGGGGSDTGAGAKGGLIIDGDFGNCTSSPVSRSVYTKLLFRRTVLRSASAAAPLANSVCRDKFSSLIA